jgi:hypothetical protein
VRAAVLPAFEAPLVVDAVGTALAAAADHERLTAVLLPSA